MRQSQRQALEERLSRAARRLYHLATPAWPREWGPYEDDFSDWLAREGSDVIDWLNDGGPYGRDYYATLAAPCNAGRYLSPNARRRHIAKGTAEWRRDLDANPYLKAVETFGQLYTWGRGGRTVAPDGLVKQHGGSSFSLRTDAGEEMNAERLTEAVRVAESFGDFVERWNAGVPEMWADYSASRAAEETGEARDGLRMAREAIRAMLADARAMRAAAVQAPTICATVRGELARLRREMREAWATIARVAPALATAEA
jgi:hypothetical protein